MTRKSRGSVGSKKETKKVVSRGLLSRKSSKRGSSRVVDRKTAAWAAKFPKITHYDGLSTGYAYHDNDINLLGKALRRRDGIVQYEVGTLEVRDGGARDFIETEISTIDGRTIVELPAISAARASPPELMIRLQLENLRLLMAEPPDLKVRKGFPQTEAEIYPITILAPYKLSAGGWHWNILEIVINAPGGVATCKRYNTNGNSYPVEDDVFNNIRTALATGADGQAPFCADLTNQTEATQEYPRAIQRSINCGLASAIIMHDLRHKGNGEVKNYDGTNGTMSDIALRQYAYEVVRDHGSEIDRAHFCQEINEAAFVRDQRRLPAETRDKKAREEIKQAIESRANAEQKALLKTCKGKNGPGVLDILDDPILTTLYDIFFTPESIREYELLDKNTDKLALKDNVIDALSGIRPSFDEPAPPKDPTKEMPAQEKSIYDYLMNTELTPKQAIILEQCAILISQNKDGEAIQKLRDQKETLGSELYAELFDFDLPESTDNPIIKVYALSAISKIDFSRDIDNTFEITLSTLKSHIKRCDQEELYSDETEELIKSLAGLITDNSDAQEIFKEMAAIMRVERQEELLTAPPPPAKEKPVAKKTKTRATELPPKPLSKIEEEILTSTVPTGKSKDLAISKTGKTPLEDPLKMAQIILEDLDEEARQTPKRITAEFARPRTYAGIGAETSYSYQKSRNPDEVPGIFKFKITKIFEGSIAEKLGLQIGDEITYKSMTNDIESLKNAAQAIRKLATQHYGHSEEREKFGIIKNGKHYNSNHDHQEFIQFVKGAKSPNAGILIHDEIIHTQTSSFQAAIQETKDKIQALAIEAPPTEKLGLGDTKEKPPAAAAAPSPASPPSPSPGLTRRKDLSSERLLSSKKTTEISSPPPG